jgi:hypothetical protein
MSNEIIEKIREIDLPDSIIQAGKLEEIPLFRSSEYPLPTEDYQILRRGYHMDFIGQGENPLLIPPGRNGFSEMANPCAIALAETENQEYYLFHSTGNTFTERQQQVLRSSIRGVVGGGKRAIQLNRDLLANFTIPLRFSLDITDESFGLAFMRRQIISGSGTLPPGIYMWTEEP